MSEVDLTHVVSWFFDVMGFPLTQAAGDALVEEFEEELAILARLPPFSIRRIAIEAHEVAGEAFSPAHWLEAALEDETLFRVLAFERAKYAFIDGIPLPPAGSGCWWTLGWSRAFHSSPHCSALAKGQDFVAWRGGEPADIVSGTVNDAVFHAKKRPCKVCWYSSASGVHPAAL